MAIAEKLRAVQEKLTHKSGMRRTDSTNDVTKPGAQKSRKASIVAIEESTTANAPMIWSPLLNRGTNFTEEDRVKYGLAGLLPPVVETITLQSERVMFQLRESTRNGLEKYELLAHLAARNQTLFYHVVINNLEELAPIIYTPIVGQACQQFDRIYSAPLGMYFRARQDKGKMYDMLSNWPSKNVQIIVVTDGGRILGLGDLGTNGIGISIGKIQLYVGGAGFHPEHSLPAVIDVGTNNKTLCDDKFYMGAKEPRLEGDDHMAAVEEFCLAAQKHFPEALIQFEDFPTDKAFAILKHMRKKVLCFNDDIQGTGAVVTTGFINGMKAQDTPVNQARVVFYGAGSSAVGVATSIASYIHLKGGVPEDEAKKAIWMVDTKGLITTTRPGELPEHKKTFARSDTPDMKDLVEIIKHVKPHALIGLTGGGPAFDENVVKALCEGCEKPLIFPLSNPTEKAEITAENAFTWSEGKCLFGSGTAFPPVTYNGVTIKPGQANNVFIFPGVGFGAVMAKATECTDSMFASAAQRLADCVPIEKIKAGELYPELCNLREISIKVAAAVAHTAIEEGIAQIEPPEDMEKYLAQRMWKPTYMH